MNENNAQVIDESLNSIRKVGEEGQYYWTAREFGCVLGYSTYQKFQILLNKSINEAKVKGLNVGDHFNLQVEMVKIGSNAKRSRENYYLSKVACLIILDNADRKKDAVKGAINYFSKRADVTNDGECDLNSQLTLCEDEKERIRERNKRYWEDLNRKASSIYIKKTECLMKVKGFKRDDSFHGNYAPHHIMYKLDTLKSVDGNRAYEFLIEYDVYEPTVGIYYGCKGLILNGDQDEEIAKFIEEWQLIKSEIGNILNNTFPSKRFTHRFKPTNNANNNTYWPFWITLYDEEDIVEVAGRAIWLIMKYYKEYFKLEPFESLPNEDKDCKHLEQSIKEDCKKPLTGEKRMVFSPTETAFTEIAYNKLLKKLESEDNKMLFNNFVSYLEKTQRIVRVNQYEKAFAISSDYNSVDFTYHIVAFFNLLKGTYKKGWEKRIPWESIEKIFLNNELLSSKGTFKNLYYKSFNESKNAEEYKKSASEFVNELLNTC